MKFLMIIGALLGVPLPTHPVMNQNDQRETFMGSDTISILSSILVHKEDNFLVSPVISM